MEGLNIWEHMIEGNLRYLTKLPAALVTLAGAIVLLKLARKLVATGARFARVDPSIQSMILSVLNFVGWTLALAAALSVMELNQLSLALGGSVALIAMALATGLNSVAQDLMAGIFLLGEEHFRVGNRVKAGGVEGVVEALSIRKTKIRDDEGRLHTVPNRTIDQSTYVLIPAGSGAEEQKTG